MTSYTLHYWSIKARNWAILVTANYGGITLDWKKETGADYYKKVAPFGQLPLLEGPDGLVVGQSMAILRFVARKANLQGDNDAEYVNSEQLIEEAVDIGNLVGKANSSPNKEEAYNNLFATDLPKHLTLLENSFEKFFGGKTLVGQLAIFATLNIASQLEANATAAFPKLHAWYQGLASNEKLTPLLNDPQIGMYYARK